MNKLFKFLLPFLLIGFTAAQTVPFEQNESLPNGPRAVYRVLDGDTFSILVPLDEVPVNEAPMSGGSVSGGVASGGSMSGGAMSGGAAPLMVERSIRVLDLDTPEVRGNEPFNKEATAYAVAALEGRTVKLTTGSVPIDRYGRALAYVTLPDGSDYGLGVLSAGLADTYGEPSTLYRLAKEGAQSTGKGLHERPKKFDDRNCGDFSTQGQAQVFFEAAQLPERRDAHRLDGNNDGVACDGFFKR